MMPRSLGLLLLCLCMGAALAAPEAGPARPNLFPSQTWQPPAPPPPPPPPPPKPTAPALPFQYAGRLEEGGNVMVFLALQNRRIVARQGDVIDNLYRVEEITSGTIAFTYLPLQQRQQLMTGTSQ